MNATQQRIACIRAALDHLDKLTEDSRSREDDIVVYLAIGALGGLEDSLGRCAERSGGLPCA